MKYSIDKLHQPFGGRRSGNTTRALSTAIGLLMVTEKEPVFFIVRYMNRWPHIKKMFNDFVKHHYNEIPENPRNFELGIKGYSSYIVLTTIEEYERRWSHKNGVVDLED